ncbi:MAG TPA: hypothetical protein VIY29_04035 [Ktedonobacteraceae bacterium]
MQEKVRRGGIDPSRASIGAGRAPDAGYGRTSLRSDPCGGSLEVAHLISTGMVIHQQNP